MDRPPVHELSAVNGHCLRFKYRATTVPEYFLLLSSDSIRLVLVVDLQRK
jgi:hypothetical protein